MIRVALADDHALVRDGMRRTLSVPGQIEVVGDVASSTALLDLLRTTAVDVACVDVAMPGVGFVELLKRLQEEHPGVRTVVVSARDEEEYALRALRAGAMAYVDKARSGADLLEAVRAAARAATWLTAGQSERLRKELRGEGGRDATRELSSREYQVLGLLAGGRSMKEIAATLSVSVKTASTYRARLLEKLHLRTTAELIRFALEHDVHG